MKKKSAHVKWKIYIKTEKIHSQIEIEHKNGGFFINEQQKKINENTFLSIYKDKPHFAFANFFYVWPILY